MFQSEHKNPKDPGLPAPGYQSSYPYQESKYHEELTRELTALDQRRARKFEGVSQFSDGRRNDDLVKSQIDALDEVTVQKIGKKIHKSLFRRAKYEESKDGQLTLHQQKVKNGALVTTKSFSIRFLSIQKFGKHLSKRTKSNPHGWDKGESSYRLKYDTTPKRQNPVVLYFNHPGEAYEFLVKSNKDLRTSLISILDDYKRRKDEARMDLCKAGLLERIKVYAERERKRKVQFLESYDNRMIKEMMTTWLGMSKWMEEQRKALQLQEEEKPLENSIRLEEEEDPFEEQRRIMEQKMREREAEERRREEEEKLKIRLALLQQHIRSIQKNQAFLDCNRFHLNRLAREWRALALDRQRKQRAEEQALKVRPEASNRSVYVKVLEVSQSVISEPELTLSLSAPVNQRPAFNAFRHPKNEKKKHKENAVSEAYFEERFTLQVAGQHKCLQLYHGSKLEGQEPQIRWELEEKAASWQLGATSFKVTDPKDVLEFVLRNRSEDPENNKSEVRVNKSEVNVNKPTVFHAYVGMSDLLKEYSGLGVYYLALNGEVSEEEDKRAALEPIVKFNVFIGESQPRELEWDEDRVRKVDKKQFLRDPVYDELVRLPKYTPKNLGFLIQILRMWGVCDIEMDYRRLIDGALEQVPGGLDEIREEGDGGPELDSASIGKPKRKKPKALLQEIRETLTEFAFEEIQRSHARSSGNLLRFNDFEHRAIDSLRKVDFSEDELHRSGIDSEDAEPQNRNGEDDWSLLKLRRRKKRLDEDLLGRLEGLVLRGGVPNSKRPLLWGFLGSVEEIRSRAVTFLSGSLKLESYEKSSRPREELRREVSLAEFYERLVERARESEVCHLVRQLIADDISLLHEIDEDAPPTPEFQEPLNNILSAFAILIDLLKSTNPQHIEPYKHIFYSTPVLKIARKVISLISCKSLDRSFMRLEWFLGSEQEDLPSGRKKGQAQRGSEIQEGKLEYLGFWMLVSLVTHALSGYYVGIPHELNKEIKTPLRESYQDEIGLKRDLLILKFYLKEHEPAIFQLFEDISLPLEYFFGNMLLSAGAEFLHNEVLFRFWDLLFLMKEREKEQDLHFTLVALVVLILKMAKEQILRGGDDQGQRHAAKDSREINEVLKIFETVARFLPQPDQVVREVLVIQEEINGCLREHYAEFNSLRADLNAKFGAVRHQNKMFYDLVHSKNNFEDLKQVGVGVVDIFRLLETLKRRHKLFWSSYQEDVELPVPEEFGRYESPEAKALQAQFQQLFWFPHFDWKNEPNFIIHLFLHKMALFGSREELPFKLEIRYRKEVKATIALELNTTAFLNYYIQIPCSFKDGYREGHRDGSKDSHQIVLQITLEREWVDSKSSKAPPTSQKEISTNRSHESGNKKFIVKQSIINLDGFLPNYLQKSIAKLDFTPEEAEFNEDFNLTTSELEYSLVMATDRSEAGPQAVLDNSFRNNPKLMAQSLPKPLFKVQSFERIKEVNLERFHERFLKGLINVLGLEHISNAAFSLNPNEWRRNSRISYEEFRQTLKAAKFVDGAALDYFALYNSIMNANRDKSFYFTDFMVLLILFSHTTPKQKSLLLYDTLLLFDNSRDPSNGVSILSVKSLVAFLYETFMLSIPHYQVDNIVEYLVDGYVSGVISAKLDYKNHEKSHKTLNFTNALIHVSNYLHYYYHSKQLFLGEPGKLSFLKEVLENIDEEARDILGSVPTGELLRLNLKYRLRGLKHKLQVLFDKNWEVKRKLVLDPEVDELRIPNPERYKLIENLLLQNENVIPLGNTEGFLSKQEFIQLMVKLPMMSYFMGFSIFGTNEAKLPQQISCLIQLDQELIGNLEFISIRNLEPVAGEQSHENYKNLCYDWNQKRQVISDQRIKSYSSKASSLTFKEFPYYESFFSTLKLIQIKIMNEYLYKEEVHGNAGGIASSLINSGNLGHAALNKKVSKPPEYSKIFDLDFRKVTFDIACLDFKVSGLFYCSLFDLVWLVHQNLGKFRGEIKLVLKYFSRYSEKTALTPKGDLIIYDPFKRFELKYHCLALYFYSYQSKEWLPCKIMKRFYSKRKKEAKSSVCSYYGVIFQREPEKLYLKRRHEIYIPTFVDVEEIEEGNLKEPNIEITSKDVVSTRLVRNLPEQPASTTSKKDIQTIKEETKQQASQEPAELLKSYHNKSRTRESNEKEDLIQNPPSTSRSAKTDPQKRSLFAGGGSDKFANNLREIGELHDSNFGGSSGLFKTKLGYS